MQGEKRKRQKSPPVAAWCIVDFGELDIPGGIVF
jgi:hypothetical protein